MPNFSIYFIVEMNDIIQILHKNIVNRIFRCGFYNEFKLLTINSVPIVRLYKKKTFAKSNLFQNKKMYAGSRNHISSPNSHSVRSFLRSTRRRRA